MDKSPEAAGSVAVSDPVSKLYAATGRTVTERLYEYLAWWQQRYGFVPRRLKISRRDWIELCVENRSGRFSDEDARIDAETIISCNFWGVEIAQRAA